MNSNVKTPRGISLIRQDQQSTSNLAITARLAPASREQLPVVGHGVLNSIQTFNASASLLATCLPTSPPSQCLLDASTCPEVVPCLISHAYIPAIMTFQ